LFDVLDRNEKRSVNMKRAKLTALWTFSAVVILGICWLGIQKVYAHCDSLDGPVIMEARVALEKGDVTPLFKWVTKEHEKDIRKAFEQALSVRTKGKDAHELADRFFFETLVRIHRAGEGAPYTGLKPAGTTVPAVAAADKALAAGSVDALSAKIGNAVRDGIRKRFAEVTEKKKHVNDSVEAGREFVAAYVEYVHFVEGIHNMVAQGAAHVHGEEHQEQ
jgi:hypothetical protein